MSAIQPLEVDDTRLAHAVAAGDAAAFDELYRLYAGRLAAYGGRVAGDPAAGEDVAQVALLNAYEALRRGTRPRHLRAWLYRIAHNAALEARRRRPACAELDEEREPAWADESSELRATLLEALGDLPERQRAAYLLREVQGLRIAEIGAALELTTEQVEQALFAARNRLAEQLTFGRRIDCDAAHELADAPELAARRALKSHVRSCPSCRSARRGRAGLGALGPLSALRDALAWLLGGGGAVPAAAKLGAVAVTAAVAAVPAVVPNRGGDTSQPQRVPAALVAEGRPASPPSPHRRPAAHAAPPRTRPAAPPVRRPPAAQAVRRAAPSTVPVPDRPAPTPVAPEQAAPADEPALVPSETAPSAEEPPAGETAPVEPEEPAPAPVLEPEPIVEESAPAPVEEARPELAREPEREPEPALVVSELESTPAPAPVAEPEPAPVDAEAAVPRSSEPPAADQDSEPVPALSR